MSKDVFPGYSVLMSVYGDDCPDNVNSAIKSMVEQTVSFHDFVIVCDGPLTPALDDMLALWANQLGNRMILHRLEKNGGLGLALQIGLPLCGCDVVARMDSDDISRKDRCEKLLRAMTENDLDLVGGSIEEFDKTPGDMGALRIPPLSQDQIDAWFKTRNPFNHMSVMFRRHSVIEVGGYQPFPWLEDYYLWARIIANGCRYANISDVVVDVRTGDGMYARRSNFAYLRSQIKFFGKLHEMGLINRLEEAKAIGQRTVATILPVSLVKVLYNKILRDYSQ